MHVVVDFMMSQRSRQVIVTVKRKNMATSFAGDYKPLSLQVFTYTSNKLKDAQKSTYGLKPPLKFTYIV